MFFPVWRPFTGISLPGLKDEVIQHSITMILRALDMRLTSRQSLDRPARAKKLPADPSTATERPTNERDGV
jgi:hypothetical protein